MIEKKKTAEINSTVNMHVYKFKTKQLNKKYCPISDRGQGFSEHVR